MAKKRSDIDSLFRSNVSDYELSETKDNWELLNHLLNEQDRKKKNRKLILFFFSFFIILSTGLFIFLPSKEKKEKEIVSPANSNAITKSPSDSNPPVNNKITKNKVQETNHTTIPSQSEEKNTKQNLPTSVIKPSTTASNSNIVQPINTNAEITLIQHPETAAPDSNITVLSEIEISKSVVLDLANSKSNDSITGTVFVNETANQNSVDNDSINIKANNDSLIATAKNNSSVDSTTKKLPLSQSFGINFFAGLNIYSTSNATNSNQEHISPLIGLEFLHSLTSHFSIGLGGLYSLQGGYHLSDTASKENYFLEQNTSQQTIQIHKLHKLYFPLTFYYAIAPKHSVSAGVQLSYLVNTIGDYTETNKVSGTATVSNKNNVTGYMDGIKSTNYAVSLGYKYSLSKTFECSTRITRELLDSYTQEYFYGIDTKPSFSFQAFLILKL